METENGAEIAGSLNVQFKHPEYGSSELELRNEKIFSRREGLFFINPKQRELGGHEYYLSLTFKVGLEVGKIYTLDEDDSVKAHLEIDSIEGDKSASGTFLLSRGTPYFEGEFKLFEEGVFSADGTFSFYSVSSWCWSDAMQKKGHLLIA